MTAPSHSAFCWPHNTKPCSRDSKLKKKQTRFHPFFTVLDIPSGIETEVFCTLTRLSERDISEGELYLGPQKSRVETVLAVVLSMIESHNFICESNVLH